MKMLQRLLVGLSLAAATGGAALAGEDSTERYQGFGPEYWNVHCGLQCFDPVIADQSGPPWQP